MDNLCVRESIENTEAMILAPFATLARNSLGRDRDEPQCELRTVFQRDRDRIIHSKAFRRLKHKTQVYLSPSNDHLRTRLIHTLEVSQVARTIARSLRLNEDLTEAAALGHDLGHTPFGHAGERVLNDLLPGGFRHYEQSVRVVEKLEKDGRGLNLTKEVRDGILCHTRGKEAFTPEGRIIRIADKIAYMNHDIDDSIRAGIMSESDIPQHLRDTLGTSPSIRINNMILNVYNNSFDGNIAMSEEFSKAFYELHSFLYSTVYKDSQAKKEEGKAEEMLEVMYRYLCRHPHKISEDYSYIIKEEGVERAVADYISGMSDNYAVSLYIEWFVPRGWDAK